MTNDFPQLSVGKTEAILIGASCQLKQMSPLHSIVEGCHPELTHPINSPVIFIDSGPSLILKVAEFLRQCIMLYFQHTNESHHDCYRGSGIFSFISSRA